MPLFNMCCLDFLEQTKESWDIAITSPPYNMGLRVDNGKYKRRAGNKHFTKKYSNFEDAMQLEDFYSFHKKVLELLISKTNLVFYNISIVTGSKRAFFRIIGDFYEYLKDIIVWHKPQGSPSIANGVLTRKTELILVFDKNNAITRTFDICSFSRGTLNDIWTLGRDQNHFSGNLASFPLSLPCKILSNFAEKYSRIIDPFMGTGTTGIAAHDCYCDFTGIERDENTFEYARNRIENHKKQLRLFS